MYGTLCHCQKFVPGSAFYSTKLLLDDSFSNKSLLTQANYFPLTFTIYVGMKHSLTTKNITLTLKPHLVKFKTNSISFKTPRYRWGCILRGFEYINFGRIFLFWIKLFNLVYLENIHSINFFKGISISTYCKPKKEARLSNSRVSNQK